MSHRLASYKQRAPLDHHHTQAHRRLDALHWQRARRSDTFDRFRGIEDLEHCFLSDSDDGRFEDADESVSTKATGPHPNLNSNQTLVQSQSVLLEPSSVDILQSSNQSTDPDRQELRKYRRFANRCMRAELLDLSNGLPDGFEEDWILVGPVPRGKRCLILTSHLASQHKSRGSSGPRLNTLVLSRSKANLIGRFCTVLPMGCILDCIYQPDKQALWVLDVLKWKDQSFIDCESDFRFYWRDTKLQELTIQSLTSPAHLLIAPVPYLPSCSKARALDLTSGLIGSRTATTSVMLWRAGEEVGSQPFVISAPADGLLMYLKSATYESGDTVLAGWIPLETEEDQDSGVVKLATLCQTDDQMQQ